MSTDSAAPVDDSYRTLRRRPSGQARRDKTRNQLEVGDLLVGRYAILDQLGRGGFGAVYRALDRELNRHVAVKRASALRSFVAGRIRGEAKAIASLNHPNIIAIYDLITVSDHDLLIVMECPDGMTLAERLLQKPIEVTESVEIVFQVAAALQHAHSRQLVHSDLKPRNILVASDGRVRLLDFGLAVACFPDPETDKVTGGTPGYMSPEQIRGESHLIDGRADIWALGVIFYQLLTGVRPFVGCDGKAVYSATLYGDPPPLRQLCPQVDGELQRIIYRCLEKRMSDRYGAAGDLIDDLQTWRLHHIPAGQQLPAPAALDAVETQDSLPRFSSRGLQPFTEHDVESYLSVVPGSRDRTGVPDSIRFWTRWVESDDPEENAPVGVLYGPSGSGKTSFVRAGLIRQLDRAVCCVYVECRAGDLGGRISRIIQSRIREESTSSSLRDLLTKLRTEDSSRRGFRKLLIVVDQFEVWAQRASTAERHDFADALRQCDGIQIRALVVTRDDYWMGVTELLRRLEVPLREGRNVASVDLIDSQHACRILESIGRSTRSLPPEPDPLTSQQKQFIQQAVDELATGESIIAVHLVIFAQMAMTREWTPRTLRAAGGVTGACSLYFQELFGAPWSTANRSPEYRRIAPAVLPILSALLPKVDHSVAESAQDELELYAEVRRAKCEHVFKDCLAVLVEDLRILTVVDDEELRQDDLDRLESPDDSDAIDAQLPKVNQRYRLSHDFLVEPIREWIDRARKRTWRGRKLARLSEIAGVWDRQRSTIFMPGFFEYLSLLAVSRFAGRGERESEFIRAATRHHSGRISVAVIALVAFLLMTGVAIHQGREARAARSQNIASQVALLMTGPANTVMEHIRALSDHPRDAVLAVTPWADSDDPQMKIRAQLFLQSQRKGSFSEFAPLITEAPAALFLPILEFARSSPAGTVVLRNMFDDDTATDKQINRTAILLHYLGNSDAIRSLLAGSDDYNRDSSLWLEAADWRGGPDPWIELLQRNISPDLNYHAAVILSSFPRNTLLRSNRSIDVSWMVNSPRASVHSAGIFLEAHLGRDPTTTPLSPPTDANWRVGPDSMPMVRVSSSVLEYVAEPNSPEDQSTIEIKQPFWVSTIPVSRRLYSDFLAATPQLRDGREPKPPATVRAMPELLETDPLQPVVGITHSSAIELCNWISERESLEPCYVYVKPHETDQQATQASKAPRERWQRGSEQPVAIPKPPWRLNESANGYRLPTVKQFVFIARCGYLHGDPWSQAMPLAEIGGDYSKPPGSEYPRALYSLMPNRLGIFCNDRLRGAWIFGRTSVSVVSLGSKRAYADITRDHVSTKHSIYFVQVESLDQ